MKRKVFLCTVCAALLCSSAAYAVPEYYVPWPCGVTHKITQGNSDGFSHTGFYSEYAWDISMGLGEDIVAPLDGYVVQKEESFQYSCYNNGCTNACLNSANSLTICVTDRNGNTFGIGFAHMMHNGVDVEVGQSFKQGQVLAHAGTTGCSTGTHLHITAMKACASYQQSIPSSWIDIGVPYTGQYITSNNCPKACEPSPEVCDGQDNDCDGHVDEDEVCPEPYEIKYQAMNYDPQNTDINGDGRADMCIRGSAGIHCMISDGDDYTHTSNLLPEMKDEHGWGDHIYYRTIRFADINGDGKADICARRNTGIICWPSTGTGFGDPTPVFPMSNDDGYYDNGTNDPNDTAYLSSIRFGDINGDKKDDFCARFKDSFKCYLSNGNGFDHEVSINDLQNGSGWQKPHYTSTIRMADVDGDGKVDVCARGLHNVYCWYGEGGGLTGEMEMNNWGWDGAWREQKYYATFRFADINGDGKADLCGRDADGIICQLSTGRAPFGQEIRGPAWSDANGWGGYDNYSTIMFGDLNGDGKDDVCARADAKVTCHLSTGDSFNGGEYHIDAFSDANGWNRPEHFRTLRMGDIDGDGRMDICGRGVNGIQCFLFNGEGFTEVAGPGWKDTDGWPDPRYYSTYRLGGPFGNPCSKREEICGDGIDNNCNGQADEDCPPPCVPSDEVCDELDNDCDGEVDEGLDCRPEPVCEPSDEVCDGLDNDCDGDTDEDGVCDNPPDNPKQECDSEETCEGALTVDVIYDEDCGCSTHREPTSNGGLAWLLSILGMLGLMRMRRKNIKKQ